LLGGGLRFNPSGGLAVIRPAESIAITGGAGFFAETRGSGNAGFASVVGDRLTLSGGSTVQTRVFATATGSGGDVLLSGRVELDERGNFRILSPADRIELLGGAQVRSETAGTTATDNAGSVRVVGDSILFGGVSNNEPSGVITRVEPGAAGAGGNIFVVGRTEISPDGSVRIAPAQAITLRGGAQLQAQTAGASDAGEVLLVGDRVTFRGLSVAADAAGDRTILPSGIVTRAEPGAQGAGGDIAVVGRGRLNPATNRTIARPARRVSLRDGAQLQAQTAGDSPTADAGDVFVVANRVTLDGITNDTPSGISTSVEAGGQGSGGAIFIGGRLVTDGDIGFDDDAGPTQATAAQSFSVQNGAQLLTRTAGSGDAGNVYIFSESIDLDGFVEGIPSAIFSGVDQGTGQGGTIFITAAGELIAPTSSQGVSRTNQPPNASRDPVTFNDDGSIDVDGEFLSRSPVTEFTIADGAIVSVSSFGLGSIGRTGEPDPDSIAGNIFIHTRSLDMNNNDINIGLENERGIFAETGAGNSGNIDLAIEDLLLMRGATRISTTAGTLQQPGDGGFITITTDDEGFVIAEPFGNNDITSNAFFGEGGEVEITAEQILGLFFRSGDDLRDLLNTDDPAELDTERLPSSDVTALSQTDSSLDGRVIFNVIGVDPTQGLVSLPTDIVDATDQIGQVCPTGPGAAAQLGRFVVTGRGGISPSPLDVLDDPDIAVDWLEEEAPAAAPDAAPPQSQSPPPTVVEADGWTRDGDGRVQLVTTRGIPAPGIGEPPACP
jgi:hypothetical protein